MREARRYPTTIGRFSSLRAKPRARAHRFAAAPARRYIHDASPTITAANTADGNR